MANITLPENPTDGQKVTVGQTIYQYNESKQRWVSFRLNIAGRNNIGVTNTPPLLNLSNTNISFTEAGAVFDLNYSFSDASGLAFVSSISNSGIANTSVANIEHFTSNNTIRIIAGGEAITNGSITIVVSDGRLANTATANVVASFGFDWSSVTEQQKIQASDASSAAEFGYAVSIDGDTVVVGALYMETSPLGQTGAVYVFTRSGSTWTQQAKILSSDIQNADLFGASVAISGDTIIVGAIRAEVDVSDSGTAYIFTRSGSTWTEQAQIQASDRQAGDRFGNSVAIDGDTVVVGAEREDTPGSSAGAAYVFTRSGSTWTQQQKIQSSDVASGDNFGWSVAIDGDTILVGAKGESTGAGAAYVFTRSGSTWTQQAKIQASDAEANDSFGYSLSIDGDTCVIGALTEDTGGTDAGAAYIFTGSGSTWTQQAKIQSSDIEAGDYFGYSVAIQGDIAIVGATEEDTGASSAGAVYIFTRDGSTWTEQAKIQASDLEASDDFGNSVAIDVDTVVVGAFREDTGAVGAGATYIFTAG